MKMAHKIDHVHVWGKHNKRILYPLLIRKMIIQNPHLSPTLGFFYGLGGERASGLPDGKQSPLPMAIRDKTIKIFGTALLRCNVRFFLTTLRRLSCETRVSLTLVRPWFSF